MNKTYFRLVFVFVIVVGIILAYLHFFLFIPSYKKLIKKNLIDKADAVFYISGPLITKAVNNNDDLLLLSQIDNIMKVEDISAIYILDNDEKVTFHNKTNEWGNIYKNKIHQTAVNAKKKIVQINDKNNYLFSSPITSSETICIEISTQKSSENFSSLKEKSLYTLIFILSLSILGFLIILYYTFKLKFDKLNSKLKSILAGHGIKMELCNNDEFKEISELIDMIIENTKKDYSKQNYNTDATQTKLIKLFDKFSETFDKGLLIADSENKIITINQKAKDFLAISEENVAGLHILDIIKSPELIKTLQKAAALEGKPLEETLNNQTIKIIVSSEVGTIMISF